MSDKRVMAAVKAVVQKPDGSFLVIRQDFPGRSLWDFPGGRVEHGENPYETLAREVREETGLTVTIGKALGLFWFTRVHDGHQVVCTVFLCNAHANSLEGFTLSKNPDTSENIGEFRWVTKADFLDDSKYPVSDPSVKKLVRDAL